MKEIICTIAGVVGSFIAGLFGGWDTSLVTLLLFMGIDYITGLAVAACGKSPKSDTGRLSSKIGWRGIAKKCVSLLLGIVRQPWCRLVDTRQAERFLVSKWTQQALCLSALMQPEPL